MNVTLVRSSITDVSADAVVVNLFEGVQVPGGATGAMDKALDGLIRRLISRREFKGKLGETAVLHVSGKPFEKVVLVGLGKSGEFNLQRARQAAAAAARAAARGQTRRLATIVHGAGIGGLDPQEAAQAVVEGSLLALYRYDRLKTDPDDQVSRVQELIVTEMDASKLDALRAGIHRGQIMAEGTCLARDLANTPSNMLTPAKMAEEARRLAQEWGLEYEVLEPAEMERLGMGALLAVAKGSQEPPRLIILRYQGGRRGEPPLALVGKGITFDTGGISLKPSQGMEEMKFDMAGGAAVLGAMQAIARLKPSINVLGVVPCAENMPSGSALKPGDVVRTMNGKTVEVDNTDAEGRLILADAIAYAVSQGAREVVDVATLTGACVVALGKLYTGVVANSDRLFRHLQEAAAHTGERFWRLPGDPDYKEQLKSEVADLKNTGGRPAGAITGALFIGEFVQDADWVHLDIAGTAYTDKESYELTKGATGVATRTLVRLAELLAENR